MKPLPAPNVPGKSEFEKFDNAVRQVLSASKEELLKWDRRSQAYRESRLGGRDPVSLTSLLPEPGPPAWLLPL
jgi:hypothetical protein